MAPRRTLWIQASSIIQVQGSGAGHGQGRGRSRRPGICFLMLITEEGLTTAKVAPASATSSTQPLAALAVVASMSTCAKAAGSRVTAYPIAHPLAAHVRLIRCALSRLLRAPPCPMVKGAAAMAKATVEARAAARDVDSHWRMNLLILWMIATLNGTGLFPSGNP